MLRATSLPRLTVRLAIVLSIAALLSSPAPAVAQALLGSAQSYAVLGASTVTNTGPSVITGDLGVSPGTAITGFPPGILVAGTRHAADAAAGQAHDDAVLAFATLGGLPCTRDLSGLDLGDLTLTPGVYCFSSTAQLTGTLTLNAQGNPDAVFVFRMGSALTTASNSSVVVINDGGGHCNVYWHATSSVTLGTDTTFVGHILALASVTMNTGADLSGSAFALTGAVTLDSNNVGVAACSTVSSKPRLCVTGSGEIAVPMPNNIKPTAGGTGRAAFSLDARRDHDDGPVTGFFEYENPVQRLSVRGRVNKLEVLSRSSDGSPLTVLLSGVCNRSVPQCRFAITVRVDQPGARDYLGIAVTGVLNEVRSLRVVRGGSIIFSQ
jgi:hypothetical protein